MSITFAEAVITIVCAVFASGGFWTFIQKLMDKRSKEKKYEREIILGMAREKIIRWGNELIDKKNVSLLEFQDFSNYCNAYFGLGGNGGGKEKFEEVSRQISII